MFLTQDFPCCKFHHFYLKANLYGNFRGFGGIFTERFGETWSQGSLVLAWDEVKQGTVDIHDGHNVVFHEFAHQLDYESGAAEGAPRLPGRSRYVSWARVHYTINSGCSITRTLPPFRRAADPPLPVCALRIT